MKKITVYVYNNMGPERRKIKACPRTRIRKCFKRAGVSIPPGGVITIDGELTDADPKHRLKDFAPGKIVYLGAILKCANLG